MGITSDGTGIFRNEGIDQFFPLRLVEDDVKSADEYHQAGFVEV